MMRIPFSFLQWSARLTALAAFLFFGAFYVGEGPAFPSSVNSLTENLWLVILPLLLLALLLGWRWEKPAGYIIVLALIVGLLASYGANETPPFLLLATLVPGTLYCLHAYRKTPPR